MQYEMPTSWVVPNNTTYGSPDGSDKWETDLDPTNDGNNG